MATTPLLVGPWSGIDNVHRSDAGTFQLPGELEKRQPALVQASDVDLDDDGWVQRRADLDQVFAVTTGLSVFSGAGLLLAQDGGSILLIDPSTYLATTLVSGLAADARITFHEHADQVFWTNGAVTGRVRSDGTATNWGCATAPTPTLGTTAGVLRAGRYLVAATFVDTQSIEHSADEAGVVVLTDGQAITVDLTSVDASTASVRLYASKPNGSELFFVGAVAPGALPATINNVEVSEEPLRTQHLSPPIASDGMFSYRGLLVLFAEKWLFPSYGVNAHLFEITTTIEGRTSNVLAGAGLDDGFWSVCENGVYWTTGETPETWRTWRRDEREYAAGVLVLPGRLIPALQTTSDVALFVCEDGLIAGLPGGVLRVLTPERLHLDVVGKRASIVYHARDNLRQLLFSLR